MKLIIPMIPPSGNALRRKYRHPQAYRRLRDSWKRTIWALLPANRRTVLIWSATDGKKARVSVHVEHARLYDQDNLVAGCKPILDSLKALEIIRDDSPAFIELVVTQAKSRDKRTTIEVTEAA